MNTIYDEQRSNIRKTAEELAYNLLWHQHLNTSQGYD